GARARRAGQLSQPVHGRAGQDSGRGADPRRLRRSPRHADRHLEPALVEAIFRRLSGAHRSPEGCWRPGADARPGGTRHSGQQPHDHAGQEPPADRRPDPEVDRRIRQQASCCQQVSRSAALSLLLATVTVAQTLAGDPAPRLRLQLQDYAQLPITGELDGQNTRGLLARVNFLRDEPGGRRFFVNDLNGPLYILDKQTKKFTVYLDFNGAGGRPGLFPKFTFERNFATGLINFLFDPDYARNGVFYTMHMEDPAGAGSPAPKPGLVAGL